MTRSKQDKEMTGTRGLKSHDSINNIDLVIVIACEVTKLITERLFVDKYFPTPDPSTLFLGFINSAFMFRLLGF